MGHTWQQSFGSKRALGVLFLLGAAVVKSFACNPAVPMHCQAYSRAEAVFVGKLLKIEQIENVSIAQINAYFQIEKVYKGKTHKVEIIKFRAGDCDPRIDEVGASYFVYKEPFSLHSFVANLTGKYFPGMQAEQYALSLLPDAPIYTVSGQILGLTETDRKNVAVVIKSGSGTSRVPLDEGGYFKKVVRKAGEISVRIEFPYKARFMTEILKEVWDSEGKEISYSLAFAPNDCDFRQISFTPTK